VFFSAVGAFKRDGVAAPRGGFIVASFDASLVPTSMGITGMGGGANGAGGGGFLAELCGVTEFAAVSALGD
jgi:hypothetical protein